MLFPLSSRCRDRLALLLTVALVIGFCVGLFWQNERVFWNDDYQISILPVFADVARSWHEGHWPLLSPYSWACGNLAGEYQYGTFSVFVNAAVIAVWQWPLSFAAQAAALSIIHLAVLAAGCFLLARQRLLSAPLSVMVGIVGALNGWEIGWGATNWFGSIAAHAWLPWAWWACEVAMAPKAPFRGGRADLSEEDSGNIPLGKPWARLAFRCVIPAPFIYLVLTGGFPYTVVMLVLVSGWLAARALADRRPAALVPLAAGWFLGLALSAPAWLSLLEAMRGSGRAEGVGAGNYAWTVPLNALPGMILPNWTSWWRNFSDAPTLHSALELSGALVPVTGLLAGLCCCARRLLRACAWDLALLATVLLLCVLPSPGVFRWSFRWLPLFHIILALVGAHAWQSLAAARAEALVDRHATSLAWTTLRTSGGFWATALVGLTWAVMILVRTTSPDRPAHSLPAWTCTLAVAWFVLESAWPRRTLRWHWLPAAAVWLSLWLVYTHVYTNPGVPRYAFDASLSRPAPLSADRLYLALYPEPEHADVLPNASPARAALLRPGSTNLFGGLRFVNGYSPIMGAGIGRALGMRTHGEIPPEVGRELVAHEAGAAGKLRAIGVDGLIVARDYPGNPVPPADEWTPVVATADGTIYQRRGAPIPAVEASWSVAPGPNAPAPGPAVIENSRLEVLSDVSMLPTDRETRLVFHRPYFPGYEAWLDGKVILARTEDGLQPSVTLPAGAHRRLKLLYRPRVVVWGGWIAGAAFAVCLVTGLWLARERPQPGGLPHD